MTNGEFDFNRLTQRASAPGTALPDDSGAREQNQIRVISSLEEMRAAVDAVAAGAQRLMSIYTPDLEPELYDQNSFLEIVKRFVLARRFAKVRVLLSDSGRLLRDNNVVALVGPTMPPAWPIDVVNGDQISGGGAGGLAAVAGYPHLTVPMGQVRGLPVGLSFIGAKWDDARILALGYAYEQASHKRVDPTFAASIEEQPDIARHLGPAGR